MHPEILFGRGWYAPEPERKNKDIKVDFPQPKFALSNSAALLQQIQEKLNAGKVVLFVGAGASTECGGPDSKALTDRVKHRFPSVKVATDDFFLLCNEVLETDGIDRKDVEECVTKQFDTLVPSAAHK